MWYRISDTVVVIKSSQGDKVSLNIYEEGEFKETKLFDTEKQAQTYITLQKRINKPIEILGQEDRVKSKKKLKRLKKESKR